MKWNMPSGWSELAFQCSGICSMSDTMESLKGGGGSPIAHPSVRIKHLTRNSDGSSRFPKLDECAHFHYENVELGPVGVSLCEEKPDASKGTVSNGSDKENEILPWWFSVQVNSNAKTWVVRRSYENFRMLDRQLHRCVYDRKFSLLKELPANDRLLEEWEDRQVFQENVRAMLKEYVERFSLLAGSLINCGPVLNWLELDNRGNRLIVTDEAAINTPAVAAAYVIKRYTAQASDEISFEVGDIISVIDMPPPEESSWWRGKKGFQVGFFPCECVEIIGDKVPQSIKIPKTPTKPVLRKHGKLIAFFRSFLLSRPSRRRLKQSGILKERVFGCDLGEHLMNTGREIPLVLKCCSEFIEEHGIVDGIYRLSGVTSNIQKLRLAFDEDRIPDLHDEAILQDIHCVASLLKMYFRELPNPLLTYHLYDKFVSAVQADEDVRLLKLRDVVQQLPPPHYRTLEYLMRHLTKVAAYGAQTGMTPKNVAIVWAPNLLRSRDVEGGGVGALHVVGVQAVLTEYLIRYTDIIFSEKMPMFHSPGPGDGTPKRTRPKSLAISTPTKLLSLEEARSRALSANLPPTQQKYIEVGGGPDNLPAKYHTVIDLPIGKRGSTKLKKSPSSWKSFFSRGWHTSSARDKEREKVARIQSPRKISLTSLQHSPLPMQDQAITELDVSHTNPKKLRSVKSAESLISSSGGGVSCRNSELLDSFSPSDGNRVQSWQPSVDYTVLPEGSPDYSSPSKSPGYHKHVRSVSHDSYFEHGVDIPVEEEQEMDDDDSVFQKVCKFVEMSDNFMEGDMDFQDLFNININEPETFLNDTSSFHASPSASQKTAQKQKLPCPDAEVSTPKVQKLSNVKQQQTDYMVLDTKGETSSNFIRGEVSGGSEKELDLLCLERNSEDDDEMHQDSTLAAISNSVPFCDEVLEAINGAESNKTVVERYGNEKTVIVEVHATQESSSDEEHECPKLVSHKEQRLDSTKSKEENSREARDLLLSLSMEATLSDTLSLSQLLSFDSPEQSLFSESFAQEEDNGGDVYCIPPMDSSLATPESPTMDNVSDMPSSSGAESEFSTSPGDGENLEENQFSPEKDKLSVDFECTKEFTDVCTEREHIDSAEKFFSSDHLGINRKFSKENLMNTEGDGKSRNSFSFSHSTPDMFALQSQEDSDHKNSIDSSTISESFHVNNLSSSAQVKEVSSSCISVDSTSSFGLDHDSDILQEEEDNKQEMAHSNDNDEQFSTEEIDIIPVDMCSRGILSSPFLLRKKTCMDKPSPISPIEESRRKFESEIGRTIVRDRQMRQEMEQIQAERQQNIQSQQDVTQDVETHTQHKIYKSTEYINDDERLVQDVELRRSPGRQLDSFEMGRKRISEPEEVLSAKKSESSSEQKRFSEPSPSQVYGRFLRMERKASVKELLSKFENQPAKEEPCNTEKPPCVEERKPPTPPPPVQPATTKSKFAQPSLFTQLKILKLQSLQPASLSSGSENSQKTFYQQPTEKEQPKYVQPKSNISNSSSISPHWKSPEHNISKKASEERQKNLNTGKPPKSAVLKPEVATTSAPSHEITMDRDAKEVNFVSEAGNSTKAHSPTTSVQSLESPGEPSKPLEKRPSLSDRNGTRRERIDRYKEERRAQLREMLQLENLRTEQADKEKAQNKFRQSKSGTGSIPSSPSHESTSEIISPGRKDKEVEEFNVEATSSEISQFTSGPRTDIISPEKKDSSKQEYRWRTGLSEKKTPETFSTSDSVNKSYTECHIKVDSEKSESEKLQRVSPPKERPKSLPPPTSRNPTSENSAMQGSLEKDVIIVELGRNSENVPKFRPHNFPIGRKHEETSRGPSTTVPKLVRERAAMFERTSDSFSALRPGQVPGLSSSREETVKSASSAHH